MRDVLWRLFQTTGQIQYYVLMKELEKSEVSENRESKRDSF